MVSDKILSQLDLEILPSDLIENKLDSSLENEDTEVQKDKEEDKVNIDNEKDSSITEEPKEDNKFTTDDLQEIQDEFSTKDKLKVMSMLTNKLSMDEIKSISSLASGGVDNDELNNIKKTLKEKLNTNDIEYLKGLYKNYN